MKLAHYLIILIVFAFQTACWQGDEANTRNSSPRKYSSASPASNNSGTNNTNVEPQTSNNAANQMKNVNTEIKSGGFAGNLPEGFNQPTEEVGRRLLKEYGSLFVARGGAVSPKTVIFKDEAEVAAFQSSVSKSTDRIGSFNIELQTAAMNALKEAVSEAKQNNLSITPRGADSAKRTYAETVSLWASRVEPALKHWTAKGRLEKTEADRIKSLSPFQQVPEVFKLEEKGMYFAKDLSKSIIYSVAPPGTSQHLSMLALDVSEFENKRVRDILAKHGWFQTVESDLPHFTFLGVEENQLTNLGLKKIQSGDRTFWLPNI